MITPRTILAGDTPALIGNIPDDYDLSLLTINNKLACWNGHEFELIPALKSVRETWRSTNETWVLVSLDRHNTHYEESMLVHFPPDPRMTEADIKGATRAYPNEDNSGWLFAHADADYHVDHEYQLAAAVSTAFDAEERKLHKELLQATVSLFTTQSAAGLLSAQSAQKTHDDFLRFRADVKTAIIAEARTKHLGWYQQNPHEAHVHEPLERALATAVAAWTDDDGWEDISDSVEAVQAAVRTRHAYETRWDQEARLAAEGADPIAGYEYCYCRLSALVEFTEANSPDPEWKFDQLKDGSLYRGGIEYTDARVATNQFLIVSLRWRRPIPDGTAPGASIGSVAWERG